MSERGERAGDGPRGEPPSGARPGTPTDLASLMSPRPELEFIAAFLKKERLSVRSSDPRRAESLLPVSSLDRWIASDAVPRSRLEVLCDGEVVPSHTLRSDDGRLRVDVLDGLVRDGVSFVVNGIDEDMPSIARLCDAIERRLGHSVWANLYVTHGRSGRALAPHYDDHDVLALQIDGKKRWFGHGTPNPSPLASSTEDEAFGPTQWDALLEPGDVLYLPRGEVHHTCTEAPRSVHVTFGIGVLTGVDFFRSILDEARGEVVCREDVTRLGGAVALAQRERVLKERLHALVESASLERYLSREASARRLRSMDHLVDTRLTLATKIQPAVTRRITLPARLEEPVALEVGGKTFVLSRAAAIALKRLVEEDGATFGDIASAMEGEASEDVLRTALMELFHVKLVAFEAIPDASRA